MNKKSQQKQSSQVWLLAILLTIGIYADYIGYNRYDFLKNSLDMSFSNSILDLEYNCIENKKLAEEIFQQLGSPDK